MNEEKARQAATVPTGYGASGLDSLPIAQADFDGIVNRMQAQGGTLTAQVQVTRKGTGKVENYTLILGVQTEEEKHG